MVGELEIVTGKRFVPGKTLLFFDEIQACPRAITALRYFHEEMPELHVIAAGSCLNSRLATILCQLVESNISICFNDLR